MLPFSIRLLPGLPISEQVVYSVKKAVVSGVLKPGDAFPSVRTLSQELRINPNTAHRVVMQLTSEGLLEVQPGKGTVISSGPSVNGEQKKKMLQAEVEKLVVETKKFGITLDDLLKAVQSQWSKLNR